MEGKQIYNWIIESKLDEGGMAEVFLARNGNTDRLAAVKVLFPALTHDPKFRERFNDEMHLQAGFEHPYAVTVYEGSLDDPHGPCIVMQYIQGITLEKLLEQNKGRMSWSLAGARTR